MDTKILNVSDLNLNFDFTSLFNRVQTANEFNTIMFDAFKEAVAVAKEENAKYVVLTGKTFEEDTLLVEEIDEFVEYLENQKEIHFIIAPEVIKNEFSWYNIINWPDNTSILSYSNDYVKFDDDELIVYRGQLNESLAYLNFKKVCIIDSFDGLNSTNFADCNLVTSQPIYKVKDDKYTPGAFLPQQFRVNNKNGFIIIELGHRVNHKFVQNNQYRLVKEIIVINENMTLDDIVAETINATNEAGRVFYEVEYNGKVNSNIPPNLIYYVKEMVNNKEKYVKFNSKTKKDYDVELIKQENAENLIGLFIDEVQKDAMSDDDKQKIIEYGLDYLL